MKISGSNTLTAPVDQVWGAMLDPAVLARCLPGCESLTTTGPDEYAMRVTAGVAAIKGTYDGQVAITDKDEPQSLRMKASGSGAPGTIDAVVDVRLAPHDGGGTVLSYDADATVGGTIGGVGQRMLAGVTRKMAGEFFTALDNDIATGGAVAVEPELAMAGAPAAQAPTPGVGAVYAGRAPAPGGFDLGDAKGFVLGTVLGGALVAIGVLLGSRLGRRR
ncbi:carbon monoxide dehydrogenase [Nostocoides sp. F2B08]|uniref:SRPBCC family protein n=1 Tax=Nostocoides sp. F2B08 TaxID=2653936 RepID=UPI0012632637|nr:carbon monoxide dehydrogenase subunit G [Tetrasphaera sp. F2B08]KAB7743645.1 carbon monoxide dehydrogenase [Tetrasphaera sp. F2B08]